MAILDDSQGAFWHSVLVPNTPVGVARLVQIKRARHAAGHYGCLHYGFRSIARPRAVG